MSDFDELPLLRRLEHWLRSYPWTIDRGASSSSSSGPWVHTRMWADEIVDRCYHDSHMYVGEDLWRCDQCGEALT